MSTDMSSEAARLEPEPPRDTEPPPGERGRSRNRSRGAARPEPDPPRDPAPPPGEAPSPDMTGVRGGTYWMGSDRHYPEEAPAHQVTVTGFWMDRFTVTNMQYA